MSIFFKDIGKKAKDLLGKNYNADGSKKFSIKTKTANGVTYAAESSFNGAKAKGKVKVNFKTDNANFKNLSLDSTGSFQSEVAFEKLLDNVVVTMSGTSRSITSHSGDISAEYANNDIKAKFAVAPFCKNTADASICYKYNDLFVGGAVGVNFNDGFDLSSYDFGAGYSFDAKNVATLHVGKKLSTVKLSGHRQQCADVALAATITSVLSGENALPAIELGGSLKIDSDTSVFGKVSAPNFGTKDLKASFSLDQKLNANASLSLTSVLDLDPGHPQNFFGSQFGLELKFGA